jgi:hypothetical protein
MDLIKLATAFRALQFYAHQAHNMTSGATFFADHGYFAELYAFAEESYDSLIERAIGKGKKPSLKSIISDANKIVSILPEEDFFSHSLDLVKEIIKECEEVAKGESLGTNNLIAGLADSLEVHVYKLQRRLEK